MNDAPSPIQLPTRVIPVVTIHDIDNAVSLAKALVYAKLFAIEITLRTPCALEAIRKIKAQVPGAILGAGSLRTPSDVDAACDAGAQFLVSPGATPELIQSLISRQKTHLVMPGCATLSEAMQLHDQGFELLKFFPAVPLGGVHTLKAFMGPAPDLKFCPTGGITPHNIDAFLNLDNVLHVGGSWMVPNDLIDNQQWGAINQLAETAAGL